MFKNLRYHGHSQSSLHRAHEFDKCHNTWSVDLQYCARVCWFIHKFEWQIRFVPGHQAQDKWAKCNLGNRFWMQYVKNLQLC